MLADDSQDMRAILLTRQSNVEISCLQFEQAGQQLGVVDLRAVGRVAVASGTGMNTNAFSFFDGEARQRQIVQIYKTVEQKPGRIELDRQAPFGEIDLNLVRALLQTMNSSRV